MLLPVGNLHDPSFSISSRIINLDRETNPIYIARARPRQLKSPLTLLKPIGFYSHNLQPSGNHFSLRLEDNRNNLFTRKKQKRSLCVSRWHFSRTQFEHTFAEERMSSIDATLQSALDFMVYVVPFILLTFGTLGCLGNFLIFTSKRLRNNSCAFYFLCTAVFELLTLCFRSDLAHR